MINSKCPYEEGIQHFLKDGDEYSNPYSAGSNERNEFERGWVQAQKRGGDKKPNVAIYLSKNYPSGLTRMKKTTKESYLRKKSGFIPELDSF